MNRFPLVVLIVALAIVTCVVWEPARQRIGLLSVAPSPTASPSPSPSPTPQGSVADESEAATVEQASTPELPPARFPKCFDDSEARVVAPAINGDGAAYRCGSGAYGAYLEAPPARKRNGGR
jgi:hypothetical protein